MLTSHKRTKVVAHRGGKAHGRENDVQTIVRALAYKPDIIEIDVRKSRDGVLYCHHGSIPLGVVAAQVYRFLKFAKIQRLVGKRDMLGHILHVIPEGTTVLLDLKDKHITAKDLVPYIAQRENVWIEMGSERRMRELKEEFEEDVDYVVNRPFFFARHVLPMVFGLTDSVVFNVNGEPERFLAYRDLSRKK